ncbi:hypothetical protein [Halospeciosus flavus]|uniref:Uncharacterized protein n=1 Tax=Halospeciosus flavus TaxID=3032283 RepID=A0ABD5Z5Q2_9EURY|nr:hypothetical protein [Halospeciosus flavus]
MSRLARDVAALRPRETVVCYVEDGRRVLGTCASVERDQSGARVFLCPVDASSVPFQLRATRTGDGWRQPFVERWNDDAECWERYGDVADVETQ